MNQYYHSKRIVAILCVFVLLMSLFAGCAKSTQPAQGTASGNTQPATETPITMTVLMNYFTAEPPEKDGPTEKTLEEYTNTKLDITWLPSAGFDDKFNIALSSGDLPMMLLVKDNKMPMVVQAVQAGAFWDLTPYLKNYPNLSKANKVVQDSVSYDGKTYGLYRMRTLARYGFVFRKDWMDNLGLKAPDSIDSLYNVMKAFTQNDPDKNGKADTIGVVERSSLMLHDGLVIWYGGPNNWAVDGSGKMTPAFMTKEYMDANNFMKKLYDEHITNGDFAAAQKKQTYDMFNNGTAGMFYGSMDDSMSQLEPLYKANPKAVADVFSQIKGPSGKLRLKPTTGWNGMLFFTKKGVKNENDLKKCLNFVDKLDDAKMQNLLQWGVEGKHYTVANGTAKVIPGTNDSQRKDVGSWDQLSVQYVDSKLKGSDIAPIQQHYEQMWKDNEQYVIGDPSAPFISETYTQNGAQLDKIITDARVKYIMGAIDAAGWQKAVDQWRQQGGDKIIKDFETAYAKAKK